MITRSILRLVVGFALAAVLLSVALPYVGIARSRLLPPPMVYQSARGRTQGFVADKRTRGTPNPFMVGLKVYLVEYQFQARTPAALGESRPGLPKTYRGVVQVPEETWKVVGRGAQLPIRYETTNPNINGIDEPWGGRSEIDGSALFSGWLLALLATLIIGYMFTPLLERIWPRGDI